MITHGFDSDGIIFLFRRSDSWLWVYHSRSSVSQITLCNQCLGKHT